MSIPTPACLVLATCCLSTAFAGALPAGGEMCVTGTVVLAMGKRLLLNCGEGPNICVSDEDDRGLPESGQRVALSCRVERTRFDETNYILEGFTVVGRGQVPAPRHVRVEDLVERTVVNERVAFEAEVEDYFVDDVDARYYYLSLKSAQHRIYGAIGRSRTTAASLEGLLGAEIRATGAIFAQRGARHFVGNRVALDAVDGIVVVKPAESDLSRIPELDLTRRWLPLEVARLPRQRIAGTVQAVWLREKVLVRTDDGQSITATIRSSGRLPRVGARIVVAGYPSTDFFNLSLGGAKWQPAAGGAAAEDSPRRLFGGELFTDIHGNHSINTLYHGAAVTLRGKVMREGERELELDLGRDTVRAHAGEETSGFAAVETGSEVEVTGIAVLESGFWREGMPFPRVRGVSVVTRADGDVRVLRRPPWWTPARLLVAFAALAALVAALAVWNRLLLRMAARRSRALVREQLAKERADLKADERTRLAIELHDSLSQNLSGIGCQLVATRLALKSGDPATARLETAERMLQSTRTELKRCLFDLRADLLEEKDFEQALRQTLRSILGACRLDVRFHVARSVMDDSQAHTVLSVVRELVANAVRHGHARRIALAGTLAQGEPGARRLLVSVRDDGTGFDPEACAGPDAGHFGLTGVRDRLSRAGGAFTIQSSPGRTYARLSLPL